MTRWNSLKVSVSFKFINNRDRYPIFRDYIASSSNFADWGVVSVSFRLVGNDPWVTTPVCPSVPGWFVITVLSVVNHLRHACLGLVAGFLFLGAVGLMCYRHHPLQQMIHIE